MKQEIMFIMDSSGSVQQSGWNTQVEFVENMIETGVNEESLISIMNFASGAWIQHGFDDSQNRTIINKTLHAIQYTGGSTYTKSALELAIQEFTVTGDENIGNLLFLITDGDPSPSNHQAVCDDDIIPNALDTAGMFKYISYLLFCFLS